AQPRPSPGGQGESKLLRYLLSFREKPEDQMRGPTPQCILLFAAWYQSRRRKPITNLYSRFLFLVCLSLLSTVCHHSSFPADTIPVAIDKGPDNLDPRIGTNSESERIDQLLFNSLVRRGPQLEILPDLATHWETPDFTTYRFHLRGGVRFHNGQELT